jgi:hypothetical protein
MMLSTKKVVFVGGAERGILSGTASSEPMDGLCRRSRSSEALRIFSMPSSICPLSIGFDASRRGGEGDRDGGE